MPLVSLSGTYEHCNNTAQPDLDKHAPSFYSPLQQAATFFFVLLPWPLLFGLQGMLLFFSLSIVLSLSLSLPVFVVLHFPYASHFPRSFFKPTFPEMLFMLSLFVFCPLCLFPLPSFFPTVSCDRSDHQAVYFDHSQDGTVCPFYFFQSCPPDFLLLFFFLFCLLLPCTSPSEIILHIYLSLPVKDMSIVEMIKKNWSS